MNDEAKVALTALLAERNTWARQMADLHDELDTARQERDEANDRAREASSERDLLTLRLGDVEP